MLHYYIEPKILTNLLTEYEVEYIKKSCLNNFHRSRTSGGKIDEIRMSESATLKKEDPILKNVIKRCLSFTDKPFENVESPDVVRYKTGGFYKPHQDAVPEHFKNHRQYTFVMCLNDDYEGGETSFPNLDLKYKMTKGDVLLFHTLDNLGAFSSLALHGGDIVKSGEKWICNLWIHQHAWTCHR